MERLSSKIYLLLDEPAHWCPGCQMLHRINVRQPNEYTGAIWTWNGDAERPTFSPSINVVGRCHYFIRDGRIEFCWDSKHALAGQSVDLPVMPREEVD